MCIYVKYYTKHITLFIICIEERFSLYIFLHSDNIIYKYYLILCNKTSKTNV